MGQRIEGMTARDRRPRTSRLSELALDELERIGYRYKGLIPAAELRAVLCRATRRFIAEHHRR